MGQTLSEPITEKVTEFGQDERISWASSGMQGWRLTMEDAHTSLLSLPNPLSSKVNGKKTSFFAVFDGHGGHTVAQYAGQRLHHRLANEPEFHKGNFRAALKNAFLGLDSDLRQDPNHATDTSGCTAVAALITDDWKVYVANSGDSRAVLGAAGGEAVPLSFDHKPVNPDEMDRIRAAGGFVDFGRVNGNLALSRAFGDFNFKKNTKLPPEQQIVTADPEIIDRLLDVQDEFIVIACDGIWDCMSNQQVVNFIRENAIATEGDLAKVAEMLMDKCLAPQSELGSYGCDNMTVSIIALLRGRSLSEWVKTLKQSVSEHGLIDTIPNTNDGESPIDNIIAILNEAE